MCTFPAVSSRRNPIQPSCARPQRAFFATTSERLAPRLLGCSLVRVLPDGTRLAGRIVEVEAYAGVKDTASHAFGGRRGVKNEAMYAQPGTAYVYFTYGMHFCMNVVCGKVGVPLAVLVRALEPLEGLETMRGLRGRGKKALRDKDLCSGPGKLCQALAIDRALNGVDLVESVELFLEQPRDPVARRDTARTARIGIGSGHSWALKPLRWVVHGSEHLSARLGSTDR